jgi:hypothetical protein
MSSNIYLKDITISRRSIDPNSAESPWSGIRMHVDYSAPVVFASSFTFDPDIHISGRVKRVDEGLPLTVAELGELDLLCAVLDCICSANDREFIES